MAEYYLLKPFWRVREHKVRKRRYVPECFGNFLLQRKNVCSLVDGKSTKYSIHRHFVLDPGKTGNISFMLKLTLLLRSKVISPKVGVIHKQAVF